MTAVVLTILCALPHFVFLRHAGGLWRDEIQTVELARLPLDAAAWRALAADGPALLPGLLRAWTGVPWGASDFGLRVLGCAIGLGMLAALWTAARSLGSRFPLLSLSLLGANLTVLRGGDSIRGYGLVCVLLLLLLAALRRVVDDPSPRKAAWAALAAVLSVQVLYQSAFLVLALCLAAAAVLARRGRRTGAALALGIGAPAALSLIPYAAAITLSLDYWAIYRQPVDASWLWGVLSEALGSPRPWTRWAWTALFASALGAAARRQLSGTRSADREREAAAFCALAMAAGAVLYLAFLLRASLPTKPWYYLPPMAVAAACLDAVAGLLCLRPAQRVARLAVTALLFGAAWPGVMEGARARQTDVDVVAAALTEAADAHDIIIVNPWYAGVTFHRYYRGSAPWTTLPPLDDYQRGRMDLFKEKLGEPHPARPVLERIAATLKSGHRVWWAGIVFPPPPGEEAPDPPPAPGGAGWHDAPYMSAWTMQAGALLQRRARVIRRLPPAVEGAVNPLENLGMLVAQGWKP
jgi:hypothetical protein